MKMLNRMLIKFTEHNTVVVIIILPGTVGILTPRHPC